jgi:hypothetical protein
VQGTSGLFFLAGPAHTAPSLASLEQTYLLWPSPRASPDSRSLGDSVPPTGARGGDPCPGSLPGQTSCPGGPGPVVPRQEWLQPYHGLWGSGLLLGCDLLQAASQSPERRPQTATPGPSLSPPRTSVSTSVKWEVSPVSHICRVTAKNPGTPAPRPLLGPGPTTSLSFSSSVQKERVPSLGADPSWAPQLCSQAGVYVLLPLLCPPHPSPHFPPSPLSSHHTVCQPSFTWQVKNQSKFHEQEWGPQRAMGSLSVLPVAPRRTAGVNRDFGEGAGPDQ